MTSYENQTSISWLKWKRFSYFSIFFSRKSVLFCMFTPSLISRYFAMISDEFVIYPENQCFTLSHGRRTEIVTFFGKMVGVISKMFWAVLRRDCLQGCCLVSIIIVTVVFRPGPRDGRDDTLERRCDDWGQNKSRTANCLTARRARIL